MPAIKFDVSASDPERALQESGGEVAPVGTYKLEIISCDDEKPDNKDRRLHIVYKPRALADGSDLPEAYRSVHDYINLVQESSAWKLDQFLLALGIASKSKRTGSFDPSKQQGKFVKGFIRNESYTKTDNEGNETTSNTAKIGGIYAWDGGSSSNGAGGDGDDRWNEILTLSEDELQEITEELTELSEPHGLDGDDFDTWVEWRDALEAAMNGAAPDEGEEPEDGGDETEVDEEWTKFLGMEEDDLEANEEEIRGYAEQYDIDPDTIETWTEVVEQINDAMNAGEGGEEDGEEDGDAPEDYNSWTLPDINTELEARGLPTGGSKSQKVKRLEANDAQQGAFDS